MEAAHGGTLFMDEIGELAPTVQSRLLRALQEGEIRAIGSTQNRRVDLRLLAATHRNLESLVQEGRFREDLYYRLRVMEVHLPPLRERGDDIERLAQHFLLRACEKLNRSRLELAADTLQVLRRYAWPGNVRELGNAIERAVILCDGPQILPAHLGLENRSPTAPGANGELSLEAYFRDFVLKHQDHMTESELARRLGISRKTLWERRSRMNLPRAKA
jgi:DNA-binding NtrC family response regulator